MPFSKPTHNLTKASVQTLANVSLFLFVFPPLGVVTSLIALILANKSGNLRATSTATVGLSINIVALILFLIIVYFIRELGLAMS